MSEIPPGLVIRDFAGRGASVRGLCEAALSGAPVHAALITGPPGVGKRTLAGLLAQSLYCQGSGDKPCGDCAPCRRFLAGSHPDVHRIAAQKRVGVDAVRELIAALHAAPYEGGWRAAVIEQARALTPQAQNALLKTLEEPPARTVFLLTAVSESQLLPTVRSRCQIARLGPLPEAEVAAALSARGIDPARAAQLAPMAGGSVGEALRMDSDPGFWALRERLYAALAAVGGPGGVLAAVNALKDDKAEAALACDLIEQALRDALAAALTGQAAPENPWSPALGRAGPAALVTLLERAGHMRRMLASNVTWQAALERFLLEYAEESIRWQT